ncbi:MAG: hypothetical protein ACLQI7_02870 [Streptosporangiaceae bacterium]
MITSARIGALRGEDDGYGWITALRAPGDPQADGQGRPAAAVAVRRAGPGRDHLAGLPRERLVPCRNPVLAADRAR